MAKKRWEVQTATYFDGWVNAWTDNDNDRPVTFATEQEARAELAAYLADLAHAVAEGDIEPYDDGDFRVVPVSGK